MELVMRLILTVSERSRKTRIGRIGILAKKRFDCTLNVDLTLN